MRETKVFTHKNGLHQFWRRIVLAFLGEEDVNTENLISELSPAHIDFGKKIHCTELLGHILKNSNHETENSSLVSQVVQQYLTTWALNKRIKETLTSISETARSNLDFLFLKGSAFLLEERYPPGVRRLSDIDLLVRKRQLDTWYELLQDLGFEPHRKLSWILEDSHSRYVSSTFFDGGKNNDLRIDLHWHLVDFPARRAVGKWNWAMEPIWRQSNRHLASPEHRLLYQADHAFTHSFRRWKWGLDLLLLKRNLDFDLHLLKREAVRLNLEKILHLNHNFVKQLTGLVLLNDRLKPKKVQINFLEESFVRRGITASNRDSDYLLLCLTFLDSWLDKIKFLSWLIVPPVSALSDLQIKPSLLERSKIYGKRIEALLKEGLKLLRTRFLK